MEEFRDFQSYIHKLDEEIVAGGQDIGIVKVIPPPGWFSRTYDALAFDIPSPVKQKGESIR